MIDAAKLFSVKCTSCWCWCVTSADIWISSQNLSSDSGQPAFTLRLAHLPRTESMPSTATCCKVTASQNHESEIMLTNLESSSCSNSQFMLIKLASGLRIIFISEIHWQVVWFTAMFEVEVRFQSRSVPISMTFKSLAMDSLPDHQGRQEANQPVWDQSQHNIVTISQENQRSNFYSIVRNILHSGCGWHVSVPL